MKKILYNMDCRGFFIEKEKREEVRKFKYHIL